MFTNRRPGVKTTNARERMITALERDGLPDRVPTFVEGMMSDFQRKSDEVYGDEIDDEHVLFVGGDWIWAKYYGFDAQWLHSSPVRMLPLNGIDPAKIELDEPNSRVGRFGGISQVVRRDTGIVHAYQTGYLNTLELWEEWIDAGYFDYRVDEDWIRQWEKNYPVLVERDLVPVPVDTIFEKVREAFSFGKFAYFLRKHRDFMRRLTKEIFKVGMEFVKGVCDAGFDIITLADDTAYKNRVMYSPKIFEELVAPEYKRLNDYLHKRGLLSFYHSDGYTEPYFPGLIWAGFDGIQSLEPAAGMDLKHLKETYGDRVTLIGNLDCSRLLPFGTVEEVVAATRKCLDDAMAGGGYILGPSTDITDSCRPENVKAMVDTVKRYGVY
ncbi:MAG: uroporphyrinogen decarboxylase family protein [Promethearchaeota archaeon]